MSSSCHLPLYTSTFVDSASAAYRRAPSLVWARASPVKAVPDTLAVVVVCVPPPHADNCPERPANRNLLAVPSGSAKSVVSLKTVPVGPGCVVTTSGCFAAKGFVLYSVDVDVPLFATHSGVVGPNERPHGLTRSGSVTGATPGWSDTTGVST